MSDMSGADGTILQRYQDSAWKMPLTASQAAKIVPLVQNVVRHATASGIFLPVNDAAAQTGTARTGNSAKNIDDWMIAVPRRRTPRSRWPS